MPCTNFQLLLDQLEGLYFNRVPPAPTIYQANSAVDLLLDGIDYLSALNSALELTSTSGDFVYIIAWRLDAMVNLRPSNQPAKPLGEILAEKAAQGVDVRIIISGHAWAARKVTAWFPLDTILAVERLRSITVGTSTPLSNRVLFDSTAPALGGSHHQKVSVIKHGTELVAFAGGIDPWPNRLDSQPHNTFRNGSTVWGWHDMGVRVRGRAVADVYRNFQERWLDAASATPREYAVYDLSRTPDVPGEGPAIAWKQHNPSVVSPTIPPLSQPQSVPSSCSVQILRSRYPRKEHGTSKERMWGTLTSGGYVEVFHTYLRAIQNAECYIYIEDQYFADRTPLGAELPNSFSLFPALADAARRGVRLILVGSAVSDPDPPPQTEENETLDDVGDVPDKLIGQLSSASLSNVAVNRLEHTFVHSKLMIVDDCFAAVGSANMMSRSMYGVDSELQVGIVGASTVRDFRMKIWAEHLRLGPEPWPPTVWSALANLDTALGIWRPDWLNPPSNMWRASDNPVGFAPTEAVVTFLGPQ